MHRNEQSQGEIFIPGETGTVGRGAHFALTKEGYSLKAGTPIETEASAEEGFYYFNFLENDSMEKTLRSGNFKVVVDLAGVASPSEAGKPGSKAEIINYLGVIKMLDIISKMPIHKRPKVILPLSVLQFDIRQPGLVNIDHALKVGGSDYVMQKNSLLFESQKFLKDVDIYFAFIANTTGFAHPAGYFGPDIMHQMVNGVDDFKHGDLDQYRPFLHSKDAGRILAAVIRNIGTGGKISNGDRFFVASGNSYNMKDFFNVMAQVANRPDAKPGVPDPKFGPLATIKEISFNIEHLKKLGYKEEENMQTLAEALYWEAMRVKEGRPLPKRGLPDVK